MELDDLSDGIQKKAEQHLVSCYEVLHAEEDDYLPEDENFSPFGPFCGCETCVVREIVTSVWDQLVEAVNSEKTEGEMDQEAVNQVLTNALRRIAGGAENPIQSAEIALSESGK